MLRLHQFAVFRAVNAALLQTYFNPDEFWQSLEVAHRVCQGFGHLTWEWVAGLRSYVHPLLYSPLYLLPHALPAPLVAVLPRLWQSVFAGVNDYYVVETTRELFGTEAYRWVTVCQLLSWFNFFCLTRTYANCFETLLTMAALYHWPSRCTFLPLKPQPAQSTPRHDTMEAEQSQLPVSHPAHFLHWARCKSRTLAVTLATLAVIIRPSCAMFWAVIGCTEVLQCNDPWRFVLRECLPIGVTGLGLAMLVDGWFYGRWVVVPWEFVRFNLLEGGSALYGSHPWHWNFTQGFPVVLGPLLPLAVYGAVMAKDRRYLWQALLVLCVYSLPAHKEFRFLLPALHLMMPYCGLALATLHRNWHDPQQPSAPPPLRDPPDEQAQAGKQHSDRASLHQQHRPTPGGEVSIAQGQDVDGGGGGGGPRRRRGQGPAAAARDSPGGGGAARLTSGAAGACTETSGAADGAVAQQSPAADVSSKQGGARAVGASRVPWRTTWWRLVLLLCLGANIPIAAYFCLVHQRGLLDVTSYISSEASRTPDVSVLFLMPCHATPWHSHIRQNITMAFLDCSPPGYCSRVAALNGLSDRGCQLPEDGAIHGSESAWFMHQPLRYVQWCFPQGFTYSMLVVFDGSARPLAPWLEQQHCHLQRTFFNAHFSNEWDLQRRILVFRCAEPST